MKPSRLLPAASLSALAATSASASIVYSGVLDLTLDQPTGASSPLYFDLDTGTASEAAVAGSDFHFEIFSSGKPTLTAQNAASTIRSTLAPLTPPPNAIYKPVIAQLPSGTLLSNLAPGESWENSPINGGGYEGIGFRFGGSGWGVNSSGFAGLQINGNYGWARFTLAQDPANLESGHSITLHDFAYASEGESITAGQTAIPEPSTYAALTGLLAGSAALYARRRKRAA